MAKERVKIWDFNFVTILIVTFFYYMSVYLLLPILPIYLVENLHATTTEMAIILAGFSVVAFFVCPVAGYMIDNFKRKPILITFNIIFVIICLAYLFISNHWVFAVNRALNGAAYSMVTVFGFTMVVNSVKQRFRDDAMLYYGIVSKCGMALAPALSIVLFMLGYSFDNVFILAAIFSSVGLVGILLVNQRRQAKMEVKVRSTFDRKIFIKVMPLTISLSLLTFTFGIINNYMATYGIKNRHYAEQSAIFFTLLAAGMIILRLTIKNRIQRAQFPVAILLSVLGIVMGIMTIGVWRSEWVLYPMAMVIGAGFEMLTVTFRRMFIDMSPLDRIGTGSSNYYMSWDLGMGAGVIVGSLLAPKHDYLMIFAICSILLSVGAIFYTLYVYNYYLKYCCQGKMGAEIQSISP